jgi:hypothetical protein
MDDVRAALAQAREQQARADFSSAERSLLLALEAAIQIYSDPGLVAEALQMLTTFYRQTSQLEGAIAQASWAAEILKKRFGSGHAALLPVYRSLQQLCLEDGQAGESERYRILAAALEARP